jgi:serine/threonine protein kinase
VKPSNVLLCADGSAKISDFAIAQTQSSDATQIASVIGSPKYMSAEQTLEQDLTAATDIYYLGVVMLELLTAARPFSGNSLCSLMHSIINDEPRIEAAENARSGAITAALDAVQRALRKNPRDRFSSSDVFASALCDAFNITPLSDDNMSLQQQREALTELTLL